MKWGYALIWAGQFMKRDPDPLWAKLKFLVEYKLQVTEGSLKDFDAMDPAKRDKVAAYLAEHDLHLMPRINPGPLRNDKDTVRRNADEALALLEKWGKAMRAPIVATGGSGPYHRFSRDLPLAEQMDRWADALTPIARRCRELGYRIGIENHGDYYVSDLVELCGRVPHLGIFLDTGNTYLIGEAPLPAFKLAAPLTVGTHFKDHRVRPVPDGRPLHFEVGPSEIGSGDVPLRECYQLLKQHAPDADDLVMEIEMIPPSFSGDDPVIALEKSLEFIRSLS